MSVQTTTKWQLRFYQGTDVPDGPTQTGQLAADVDKSLPQSGTLAARAAIVHHVGLFYLSTDTSQLFISDGAAWIEIPYGAPAIPIGCSLLYGGNADPADTRFLLRDGRALARVGQYAPLFAIIGTFFGAGDGSTTFNIPDQRGRDNVGPDNMGTAQGAANRIPNTNRAHGQTHGEERHPMTLLELFAHAHAITDPGHIHAMNYNGLGNWLGDDTGAVTSYGFNSATPQNVIYRASKPTVNSNTTGITVQNSGSSTPFNVMQPGLVENSVIRVK